MRIILLLSFLIVFCGLNGFVFAQGNGIGMAGTNKPKTVKSKPEKIKYVFHEGRGMLKTDLPLTGKFKYKPVVGKVPEYEFIEAETGAKKMVSLSMIRSLTLAGAEKNINSRVDSTNFLWIDNYSDLYRQIRSGAINVFDNSRVIDEPYKSILAYSFVVGRTDFAYKEVEEMADLESFTADRPYFMQSAKATGRYNSKDFRVILYVIDLFNTENPMNVLQWQPAVLTLKNGEVLSGNAYIQPFDMRNEYVLNTNRAYVHFFDGKDFKLLSDYDLKNVQIGGVEYEKGFYSVAEKYFYGKAWNYNGAKYLIVKKIINSNSYFFRSNDPQAQDVVIMKEVAGSYLKVNNEMELKIKYLEELKLQNK